MSRRALRGIDEDFSTKTANLKEILKNKQYVCTTVDIEQKQMITLYLDGSL